MRGRTRDIIGVWGKNYGKEVLGKLLKGLGKELLHAGDIRG